MRLDASTFLRLVSETQSRPGSAGAFVSRRRIRIVELSLVKFKVGVVQEFSTKNTHQASRRDAFPWGFLIRGLEGPRLPSFCRSATQERGAIVRTFPSILKGLRSKAQGCRAQARLPWV